MVQYILTINEEEPSLRMPTSGTIEPSSTDDYLFNVTYRDKGGNVIGPLTSQELFVLRPARMPAVRSDDYNMASKFNSQEVRFLSSGGYIVFEDVDLTNITGITTLLSLYEASATLEARSGGVVEGDVLGSVHLEPTYSGERAVGATIGGSNQEEFTIPLEGITGRMMCF